MRAHTVQKAGNLSRISRDGHVYSFKPTSVATDGPSTPALVGLNVASTFTGFCQLHDRDIFLSIDQRPFAFDQRQAFLIAYRSLCRELYAKQSALESAEATLPESDRGRSLSDQIRIQERARLYLIGVRAGLSDLLTQKREFDEMLLNEDYSRVRFATIAFDQLPQVLASGGVLPEFSFAGEELQDLMSTERLEALFHATVATEYGGAFVLTWMKGQDSPERLADTLFELPLASLADAVVRFQFEHCENLFAAPVWWERLAETDRNALIRRFWTSASPDLGRRRNCLVDDGIRVADWHAVRMARGSELTLSI